MSYTEIEINGNKVGLYFGLPAIAAISKDVELLDGTNEISLSIGSVVAILTAGYENNCMIERVKPVLKNRDFYEFVEGAVWDGSIPDELKEVMKVYGSSKRTRKLEENGVMEKKN